MSTVIGIVAVAVAVAIACVVVWVTVIYRQQEGVAQPKCPDCDLEMHFIGRQVWYFCEGCLLSVRTYSEEQHQ